MRIKVAAALLFASAWALPLRQGWAEPASREVPFTQEDWDRIIRLEEGQKFLQQQIADLKDFMFWGYGVLFAGA